MYRCPKRHLLSSYQLKISVPVDKMLLIKDVFSLRAWALLYDSILMVKQEDFVGLRVQNDKEY